MRVRARADRVEFVVAPDRLMVYFLVAGLIQGPANRRTLAGGFSVADPKTVGTGPYRQKDGTARATALGDSPTPEEVGVVGGALFERQSGPGEMVIRLYGGLDLPAAERLDEQQLVEAMATTGEVRLDVTGLTEAEPEALRLFLERQRSGKRLAQCLAIRINPAQVADLFPDQRSDA